MPYVGREKDFIITGGHNVYPKEIEDILNELDKIEEMTFFFVSQIMILTNA